MAGTGSLATPITDTAGVTIAPNIGQGVPVASPYAAQTQGGMSGLGYNEPIGDTVLNVGRTPPATGGGWDKGTGQMVDIKDATQEKSWLGNQLDAFKHRYPVTEVSDNEFVRTADGMKKKSIIRDMTNTEAAMKLGKPLATLGLSGLEQSDFMVDPDFNDPRDVYNPRSTLDLSRDTGISEAMSRDTGLRLLARGGYLGGGNVGDGMSDDIPATIEGDEPAALSQGEFVIPADVVSHLGNGSSAAGSKQLHTMMERIRQARTGRKSQGKEIKPGKYMPR